VQSQQSQQPGAGTSSDAVTGRALVLGGGGAAGNAWGIGVIAGLLDAGTDVTTADVIIGTSAGSTVAAQITAVRPPELLAAILGQPSPPTAPVASAGAPSLTQRAAAVMEKTAEIIGSATDPADMRRRLGAAALESAAASDGSRQAQWRATVAARLPSEHWPNQPVLIVAVDADTGEPVVFDRHSGVDLVDAVAASCSNGVAYRIGDKRYFDGGYRRSSENADLAAGCEHVLVLSPFGGRSRMPPEWNLHLAAQVDELRAGGSRVETVFPGSDSRDLFGANAADPSARPRAARAGYEQGRALAGQVAEFWH
jgi:NTE family protein